MSPAFSLAPSNLAGAPQEAYNLAAAAQSGATNTGNLLLGLPSPQLTEIYYGVAKWRAESKNTKYTRNTEQYDFKYAKYRVQCSQTYCLSRTQKGYNSSDGIGNLNAIRDIKTIRDKKDLLRSTGMRRRQPTWSPESSDDGSSTKSF